MTYSSTAAVIDLEEFRKKREEKRPSASGSSPKTTPLMPVWVMLCPVMVWPAG